MRPSILDNLGLVPALTWLVDQLNRESNIDARIVLIGESRKLLSTTEVTIFRIVQEALNNVLRHSNATEAVVTMEFGAETLKISVQDNGEGFSLPESISTFSPKERWGLIGMRERTRSLDGTFHIHSGLGQGTLLLFEFRV